MYQVSGWAKHWRKWITWSSSVLWWGLLPSSLWAVDVATQSSTLLSEMSRVGPGILTPFYPPTPAGSQVPIKAFRLQRLAVTNEQFLAFVIAHPKWRRDRVSRLFAESEYLSHWAGPLELGAAALPAQPVTRVSWYAARAYCHARGQRLPTENEWEFAGAANRTGPDSRKDIAWRSGLMDWYANPSRVLAPVGNGVPNFWGISDLHGLIWEWVEDFNSTMVSGDNRESGDDTMKFCGAGALAATDTDDYASFMRIAFRSSLQASYTTATLGFRCATDETP